MIKDNLSDAHVHFNMEKENPVKDIINYLCVNRLHQMVLIINTVDEFKVFQKYCNEFENYLEQIEFVFGIDRYNQFWEEGFEYCKENDKNFHVKIHPRLYRILKDEIDWYVECVTSLEPVSIIVDDFLYGDSVDEDISLKLICQLARNNPEIPIIMAHAGGVNLLRHVMQTKTYSNVYYDISLTGNYLRYSSIEMDITWLLKYMSNRVFLGSDYPDFTIRQAVDMMYSHARSADLTEEKILQITSGNVKRVYGGKKREYKD